MHVTVIYVQRGLILKNVVSCFYCLFIITIPLSKGIMGRILRRKIDEFFQSGAAVEDFFRRRRPQTQQESDWRVSTRRVSPEIDDY